MKITVTAEKPVDEKMAATVTVASADVDKAIAKTYKDMDISCVSKNPNAVLFFTEALASRASQTIIPSIPPHVSSDDALFAIAYKNCRQGCDRSLPRAAAEGD